MAVNTYIELFVCSLTFSLFFTVPQAVVLSDILWLSVVFPHGSPDFKVFLTQPYVLTSQGPVPVKFALLVHGLYKHFTDTKCPCFDPAFPAWSYAIRLSLVVFVFVNVYWY